MISVLSETSSLAQLFTVLLLFLFIVVLAYFSARWMGKMQSGITSNKNIQVLDTMRLSNTKYIQIIRIGKRYIAIAVAKDTVTMLAELEEDDIDFPKTGETVPMESFKEILKKLKNNKRLWLGKL